MKFRLCRFAAAMLCCLTAGIAQEAEKKDGEKVEVKRPVKIEGEEYKFGDLFFNKKTREIRFPAHVIQDEAVLEYGLVHAITGKVHESLLATEIRPIDLQILLKLLRYEESDRDIWDEYDENGNVAKKMEDDGKGRVEFYISTTDKKGKKTTFPLSDWVERREGEEGERRKKMPAGRFAYTGSDLWEGSYIAEMEGAFTAIYRYAGAMFNSFQDASDDDDVWFPKAGSVPAIGTKVEVSIKPLPNAKPSAGWKPKPKESEAKKETKNDSESK